jgi:hypothetical protein
MSRPNQKLRTFARRAIFCLLTLSLAAPVWGQQRVVSIEEHWELQLAQPDPDRSAPQTTMVVSPNGNVEGLHFLFTLNHTSAPAYEPGGMQVQVWDGDQLVDSASYGSETFSHDSEVVRWVHRMTLEDGTLHFQVVNGESETWGAFGGDALSLSQPSALEHLNKYKPAVSLSESQVNYAENRVVSLTLMKLVWVTEDGEVHELNAPIALDTSLDQ